MGELAASDRELLRAFEACELTPAGFHHREHVRLAYIYLQLFPFDEALEKLRSGLHRLLAHFGASPTLYHETITRAWLLAVAHFISTRPAASSEEFLLQSPQLLDKDVMLTHYRRETLKSPAAREQFVPPDLEPIPRH